MKNGILTILKKELARFFGDRRLLVSILMPGLLIYFLYSFMGSAMGNFFGEGEDSKPCVAAVALPETVQAVTQQAGWEIVPIQAQELDTYRQQVQDQQWDLVAQFPASFDNMMLTGQGEPGASVALYYNSASTTSQNAYSAMVALLDALEASKVNLFDINPGDGQYDLATEKDMTGMLFSMIMPMLLMMFLYSGCASVAPESIAGEKERGTIATLLITPIRRRDIAIGKILALGLIALLSGASSALGTILSLPKLMGGMLEGVSGSIYSVTDYALLAAVILSTVLLLVSAISLISANARTIKEAQTTAMPLQIVVTLVGVSGMFGGGADKELWRFLIPLYNSAQCMSGIFSFRVNPAGVVVTVGVNLLLCAVGVVLLTKMFDSERIVYSK